MGQHKIVRIPPLSKRMEAFDKLPGEIRVALANSVENWIPQDVTRIYSRYGRQTDPVIQLIKSYNKKELEDREGERARAEGPYQGNQPDPGFEKVSGLLSELIVCPLCSLAGYGPRMIHHVRNLTCKQRKRSR